MNHVLLLTKNNLHLTKRCIDSIRAQTIPVKIHVYDNESTDQTKSWIAEQCDVVDHSSGVDLGVSEGWNFVLDCLFSTDDPSIGWHAEHVMVCNNDVVLAPHTYERLLEYNVPFVTGVSVGSMEEIAEPQPRKELVVSPDFSMYLLRKSAWQTVGPFNSDMVLYASDNAWHVEAHRKGVRLWNSGYHFYHERSSTLHNSSPQEKRKIQIQADADRQVFQSLYGCMPWEPAYADLFDEQYFGINAK
jgi:GT2 family glycosyltransferase